MLNKYMWSTLNSEIDVLYATIGFHKQIGLRAKRPALVFLTFYEGDDLKGLQDLFMRLDEHAVLPFIHLVVGEDLTQDEYDIITTQRDMTPVNYAYEASSRMGLIVVEAVNACEAAADAVIEMFNLADLPIINTAKTEIIEDGFDMELVGITEYEGE